MPNSLTESQLQRNVMLSKEGQMSSLEIIKQDLENEDIFSIGFGNVGGAQENVNGDEYQGDEPPKDFEFLMTSEDEVFNNHSGGNGDSENGSGSEIIRKMESDKQQILSQIGEEDITR